VHVCGGDRPIERLNIQGQKINKKVLKRFVGMIEALIILMSVETIYKELNNFGLVLYLSFRSYMRVTLSFWYAVFRAFRSYAARNMPIHSVQTSCDFYEDLKLTFAWMIIPYHATIIIFFII